MNCSQTTGEQVDSSVSSHALVRVALAWFDSATFSFLALLVNKKTDILKTCKTLQNLKEKRPDFGVKTLRVIFVSVVMSSNSIAILQKLRWPVMIVKLRKEQKYSKILKTIANFNKILQKFKLLKSWKPFHCLKRLPSIPISSFKIVSQAQRSINMKRIFRKFEEKKLISSKNCKSWSH